MCSSRLHHRSYSLQWVRGTGNGYGVRGIGYVIGGTGYGVRGKGYGVSGTLYWVRGTGYGVRGIG